MLRLRVVGLFLLAVQLVSAQATMSLMGAARAEGQDAAIRVTLLGTGYPRPQIKQFGPSTLIQVGDERFLFDCGRGAAIRLAQLGESFKKIDALFLTHLHSDHVVGIPDIWLSGWVQGPRDLPFRVWGPLGTEKMMAHLEKAFEFDIHMRRDVDGKLPPQGVVVIATDIDEGVVYDEGGVKITAFEVDHHPVAPALGFRIDSGGHSVALSGDTRPTENLVRFAKGVDLIIQEAVSPNWFRQLTASTLTSSQTEAIIAHHSTPQQAGEMFAQILPRLAVYSHIENSPEAAEELISGTSETYDGPVLVGEDLMRIEVGTEILVSKAGVPIRRVPER
jgi:ribonuclease Z